VGGGSGKFKPGMPGMMGTGTGGATGSAGGKGDVGEGTDLKGTLPIGTTLLGAGGAVGAGNFTTLDGDGTGNLTTFGAVGAGINGRIGIADIVKKTLIEGRG
jgi:hypothetical protein